ncbi:hypothetical protein [Goodfellowiella coeruleoviolacea]|uniref:Uncharacterized protein n=1 Tax=Goodfellowiella coeruleoviolacea TaxID=334858 RepID=A0AAE3GJY5_9PSEU|nr:hypothetical protein [Goodfellowiella coeruleoviolacea]MCP2168719.1 hypothetical protein [Goodfellowiella coeruleoviolacea]
MSLASMQARAEHHDQLATAADHTAQGLSNLRAPGAPIAAAMNARVTETTTQIGQQVRAVASGLRDSGAGVRASSETLSQTDDSVRLAFERFQIDSDPPHVGSTPVPTTTAGAGPRSSPPVTRPIALPDAPSFSRTRVSPPPSSPSSTELSSVDSLSHEVGDLHLSDAAGPSDAGRKRPRDDDGDDSQTQPLSKRRPRREAAQHPPGFYNVDGARPTRRSHYSGPISRSNFTAATQQAVPINPGQHRRHVIPNHHIVDAFNSWYRSQAESSTPAQQRDLARWLQESERQMNNHTANLWAGDGRDNSAAGSLSGNLDDAATQIERGGLTGGLAYVTAVPRGGFELQRQQELAEPGLDAMRNNPDPVDAAATTRDMADSADIDWPGGTTQQFQQYMDVYHRLSSIRNTPDQYSRAEVQQLINDFMNLPRPGTGPGPSGS